MVNLLRLTVAYLTAIINVKPETQNRRLELTGLAKPRETRWLTGKGPGLARQESVCRVFGRFWNRTDPFLRSKPGPLAGYPDLLLSLLQSLLPLRLARHSPPLVTLRVFNHQKSSIYQPYICICIQLFPQLNVSMIMRISSTIPILI
jgi:hypothetical protein